MIHFTLKGERFEFDEVRLSVKDAIRIKRATGLTTRGFLEGLKEFDVDAVCCMVMLAKRRRGEPVEFDDIVGMNFNLLADLEIEKPDTPDEDESEADPTEAPEAQDPAQS